MPQMLNVIGVGYPRTGTMSLKAALEELGLGPCYHMIEVFNRPRDARFWLSALDGEGADVSWNTVFKGFQSTVDCPAAYFWKSLYDSCPDARYILTVRDARSWYRSFQSTVFQAITHPERAPNAEHRDVQQMAKRIILDRMLGGRFPEQARTTVMYFHSMGIKPILLSLFQEQLI